MQKLNLTGPDFSTYSVSVRLPSGRGSRARMNQGRTVSSLVAGTDRILVQFPGHQTYQIERIWMDAAELVFHRTGAEPR